MKEYKPEVPTGYWEARKKYAEWEEDSIEDIWLSFDHWDQFKKMAERIPDSMKFTSADLERFQQKILAAYENKDFAFLKKLDKARRLRNRPVPAMNAIRAAVMAFDQLFLRPKYMTRHHWPTKRAVKELTQKILIEAGHAPVSSERHFPRILRKAGLWDLPPAQ
jgi:hypothetical protein